MNGVYDAQTKAAVEAFQAKYLSQIMGPWGATQPSGIVYITTRKMINQISCDMPLTLSPADLSIIDAYIQNEANTGAPANSTKTVGTTGQGTATDSNTVAVGPSIPDDSASSSDSSDASNVAAVGQASVWTRFVDFLKSIF